MQFFLANLQAEQLSGSADASATFEDDAAAAATDTRPSSRVPVLSGSR